MATHVEVDQGRPTGCPWWSRDKLASGLGEERKVADLASRWGIAESTLRDWIDRHDLTPYERLPALGREVVSYLERSAADGQLFVTARDIANDDEIHEGPTAVGQYVEPAGEALHGLSIERWSETTDGILWRLWIEEDG